MDETKLIESITQKVIDQIENENRFEDAIDQSCAGCALRICDRGKRACDRAAKDQKIPIGVSARHAHVTQKDLQTLYGKGHKLTVLAPLYQPSAFAAKETLTVIGRRMRAIEGVRILGGVRNYSQVEISRTDAIYLGLDPPIRDSGDLVGAEPITLVGPAGTVHLNEGAILATRHVHMTPDQARAFGITESDRLKIRISGDRAIVLEQIRPKIHESYVLQMHLDTDDSNAAGLRGGEAVEFFWD